MSLPTDIFTETPLVSCNRDFGQKHWLAAADRQLTAPQVRTGLPPLQGESDVPVQDERAASSLSFGDRDVTGRGIRSPTLNAFRLMQGDPCTTRFPSTARSFATALPCGEMGEG